MISQIAKIIEDGLNALTTNYEFVIQYTVGDFQVPKPSTPRSKNLPIINGILTQVPGDIDAVANLKSYRLSAILTLVPNIAQAETCRACLEKIAVDMTGGAVSLTSEDGTSYAGIAYIGTPNVGGIVQGGEDGREVPITTTVVYQLIAQGVVSSDVHFKLDGEELLAIQSAVGRANLLQSDAVANYEEMLSTDNSSACNFTFLLPYRKTPVIARIVDEIMRHQFGTVHILEYVDDYLSSTIDNAYYGYAVILKDGSLNVEAGKVVSISVTFSIANENVYRIEPPEIIQKKGVRDVTVTISCMPPCYYCVGNVVDDEDVDVYTEPFIIKNFKVFEDTYIFAKSYATQGSWIKEDVPICPPPTVTFTDGATLDSDFWKVRMSLNTKNQKIIAYGKIQYNYAEQGWREYDDDTFLELAPTEQIKARVVCPGFVESQVLTEQAPSRD